MALSGELLVYAENIWRRFPEVFITLGSPDADRFYSLRGDAGLSHSIIDRNSERVVEVVLPRKGACDAFASASGDVSDDGHSTIEAFDEEEHLEGACEYVLSDDDDDDGEGYSSGGGGASPLSAMLPPWWPSWRQQGIAEAQMDKLQQAITHLESSLDACVCREVRTQLARWLAEVPGKTLGAEAAEAPDVAASGVHHAARGEAAAPPRQTAPLEPPPAQSAQIRAPAPTDSAATRATCAPQSREAQLPAQAAAQPVVAAAPPQRRLSLAQVQPQVAHPLPLGCSVYEQPVDPQARRPDGFEDAEEALARQRHGAGAALVAERGVVSVLALRRRFRVDPVETRNLRKGFPPNSVIKLAEDANDDSPGARIQFMGARRREQVMQGAAPQPVDGASVDGASPGEPRLPPCRASAHPYPCYGDFAAGLGEPPFGGGAGCSDGDDSPGARIQRAAADARGNPGGGCTSLGWWVNELQPSAPLVPQFSSARHVGAHGGVGGGFVGGNGGPQHTLAHHLGLVAGIGSGSFGPGGGCDAGRAGGRLGGICGSAGGPGGCSGGASCAAVAEYTSVGGCGDLGSDHVLASAPCGWGVGTGFADHEEGFSVHLSVSCENSPTSVAESFMSRLQSISSAEERHSPRRAHPGRH